MPAHGQGIGEEPPAADLLLVGGDVVTMDAARRVVTGASIAVVAGRIAAIGDADSVRARFPGVPELDARGCVIVPGMINAHQHTTGTPLIRSVIPDDIDSQQSIFGWTVPVQAAVDADDDQLAATITAVESLLHGVTTMLEPGTVAHPLRVAEGFAAAGIRGRVGRWGWDVAGLPYTGSVEDTLAWQEETVKALPPDGLVTGWVTLVGHGLASDELFVGAAELAGRLDVPLTWHISPSHDDGDTYAQRSGLRPVVHLQRLGVLGPRLLLGHAVWLDDAELDAIVETGTAVASCPAAYLRLGQGYVRAGRHVELIRRGGRIALGCDAHNAADAPDVLHAAWLIAALDRDRGTATPLRADEAFALATIDGAHAVGMGEVVGSIEVGKAADLVVLDTRDIAWIPRGELSRQLVWGTGARAVRDVLVDGRIVVRDRQVTTVDIDALRAEAAQRSASLMRRAGLDAPHRWPRVAASDLHAPVRGAST